MGGLLGTLIFTTKVMMFMLFYVWFRATFPRFRFDQLMNLAWKVMLPLGLVNFLAVAILEEIRHVYAPPDSSFAWSLGIMASGWVLFGVAWIATSLANPLVTDNRPRRDLASLEVDSQI